METHDSTPRPTRDEARRALELADAEESATVNRPVPAWYYPVLAALVLVLFLVNAVAESPGVLRGILALAVALAVAVLVGRVSFGPSPYRGVRLPWGPTLAGGVVAAVLAIAPILLAGTVGAWIWIVCGVLLAALIAGVGIAYQRRTRRA